MGGGRAAEGTSSMPATHKRIPLRSLGFKTNRKPLLRTKPLHGLYGHLDRRQRGSEADIARPLRAGPAMRAWEECFSEWDALILPSLGVIHREFILNSLPTVILVEEECGARYRQKSRYRQRINGPSTRKINDQLREQ